MSPEKCKSHGIARKGGAVHITTSSMAPPPLPSVCARGEWSMGHILDVYLRFSDPGDCYAGRILAGLPVDSMTFMAMPPHFLPTTNKEKMDIALKENFGPILSTHPEYKWLLVRLLASLIYHEDYLRKVVIAIPSHPFSSIPILNNIELTTYLKKLISIKPSAVIPIPTGIPPHVKQIEKLEKLTMYCSETLKVVKNMVPKIESSVKVAIEESSVRSGMVTPGLVKDMFSEFSRTISDRLESITTSLSQNTTGTLNETPTTIPGHNAPSGLYSYGGRFYEVPENFDLPDGIKLRLAFRLWLNGDKQRQSLHKDVSVMTPVKPFSLLKPAMLPKTIARRFKVSWRPILSLMTTIPIESIRSKYEAGEIYTGEEFDTLFNNGISQVKAKASYIFTSKRYEKYSVSTWSKKITRYAIEKFGTDSDKVALPPINLKRNISHAPGRKRISKQPKVRVALNADDYEKVFGQGQGLFGMGNKSCLTENEIVGDQESNAQVDTIGVIEEVPEVLQTTGNNVIVEDASRRKRVRTSSRRGEKQKVAGSSVARSSSTSGNSQPHPGSAGFSEWLKDMVSKSENGIVKGLCAVRGCSRQEFSISGPGSHVCRSCELPVHSLCCQEKGLADDNKLYCSKKCYQD